MASEILTKVTINCSTGEEIIEPLTAEEIAALKTLRAETEASRVAA